MGKIELNVWPSILIRDLVTTISGSSNSGAASHGLAVAPRTNRNLTFFKNTDHVIYCLHFIRISIN